MMPRCNWLISCRVSHTTTVTQVAPSPHLTTASQAFDGNDVSVIAPHQPPLRMRNFLLAYAVHMAQYRKSYCHSILLEVQEEAQMTKPDGRVAEILGWAIGSYRTENLTYGIFLPL
jgi:hypothetical protein